MAVIPVVDGCLVISTVCSDVAKYHPEMTGLSAYREVMPFPGVKPDQQIAPKLASGAF
jgi:hypothetical protein